MVRKFEVPEGKELRVTHLSDKLIRITLESGFAEINGMSIREKQEIEIINQDFSIFAWFNSTILLEGQTKDAYVSRDSLVPIYLNIHKQLQAVRDRVTKSNGLQGPRVLILGKPHTGKYTLAQTLLTYAVRFNSSPVYLDLDIESGNIAVPGCMSALVVNNREGVLNPRAQVLSSSPRIQFYGHMKCMENFFVFSDCVRCIVDDVNTRLAKDDEARRGGVIVNGGSWYEENGSFPLLKEVIDRLGINAVLVIHDDRIYGEIQTACPSVNVIQLQLSGGAHDDKSFNPSISRYFCGDPLTVGELRVPKNLEREDREVTIYAYRDMEWWSSHDSTAAATSEEEELRKPYKVGLSEIMHQVLAVTNAKSEKDLPHCSILGFVFVSHVDESKRSMKLQPPIGGELPGNILIKGKILWDNS